MFKWFKALKVKKELDKTDVMIDVKKLDLNHGSVTITNGLISNITPPVINHVVAGPQLTAAMNPPIYSNLGGNVHGPAVIGTFNTVVGHAGAGGVGAMGTGHFNFQNPQPSYLVSIGNTGQEIVRIDRDGKVHWANGYQVDEAARMFAQSLRLSAELAAGVKYSSKQQMRDAVFEEMIAMAKEKGTLTADELTYMWQAAKIMDKLKGL